MSIIARSSIVVTSDSFATGRNIGRELAAQFTTPPGLLLTYLTANHHDQEFLHGLSSAVGEAVPIVGCSVQGVVGTGLVREEGYGAAVLGLGGDSLQIATARVDDVEVNTREKGRQLAQRLLAGQKMQPKVVVLLFDILCGTDVQALLGGIGDVLDCPVLGGAAAAPFAYGQLTATHQYYGPNVLSHSAVAFSICGDVHVETGLCHGCSPVGVEMHVTKAEGNVLAELDGRRAVDVWDEICGTVDMFPNADRTPALAIGLPLQEPGFEGEYLVLAAVRTDAQTGGVTLGVPVSQGATIMLHHRTIRDVLDGAKAMGDSLRQRLANRQVRAVLGFECGARTRPFLGDEATLQENVMLQNCVADGAEWIGGMFWGELYPTGNRPSFHNYSYSLLVLAE
jgi:hypothetical protein